MKSQLLLHFSGLPTKIVAKILNLTFPSVVLSEMQLSTWNKAGRNKLISVFRSPILIFYKSNKATTFRYDICVLSALNLYDSLVPKRKVIKRNWLKISGSITLIYLTDLKLDFDNSMFPNRAKSFHQFVVYTNPLEFKITWFSFFKYCVMVHLLIMNIIIQNICSERNWYAFHCICNVSESEFHFLVFL